ncbi:MAG: imelysin family protein, partial [Myxococcota bacterium]
MIHRSLSQSLSALALVSLAGLTGACSSEVNDLDNMRQVLATNADIAFASYGDSVAAAQAMSDAIDALIADPSQANLDAARDAWLVANEPYGQTEVYRFRASPIDDTNYDPSDGEDGPEGELNAWPLGEALIDYVVADTDFGDDQLNVSSHETGVAGDIPPNNIINSADVEITADLLSNTSTAEDERDVISGYHAIEFLLFGQDLNADGTGPSARDNSAGQRPVTDFANDATCTSGETVNDDATFCQRRGEYLQVATAKLIADLEQVRDGFAEGSEYRTAFTTVEDLEEPALGLVDVLD